MNTKTLLILTFTLVAIGVVTAGWWRALPARQYREEVLRTIIEHDYTRRYDLYHPLPGEHCAPGYLRIPHAFQRGVESWDGCWSGSHANDFTLDFLLPDEDAAVGATVREKR